MITKATFTVLVMMQLDFNTLEECIEASQQLYEENRCYESFGYYLKAPLPKPINFEDVLIEYRQIILEKQGY
ncbi:MAG: hypothetical protein CL557_12540 [Alphaproteobacteria bacterium]|nr:hypothetical protein [Alphaproteobacteria bacterium]|tara:strand:+ start:4005 stop:4220 length:216 start_codon:yes stop_codon:yes gene_type:complete